MEQPISDFLKKDVMSILSSITSQEDYDDFRYMMSEYFARRAARELKKLEESGEWSEEKRIALRGEHLRTPYNH